MNDNDTKRISRLTAILTQLQTKRLITAPYLADKFNVSVRTIYRDIRALEQSGVPVLTEEGKGYYLMDGYRLPPVSFTESEANALITAEKLVANNSDASLVKEFTSAIEKIRSVLQYTAKDNAEFLSKRILISRGEPTDNTSSYLVKLQTALTNFYLTKITYQKQNDEPSTRMVEPFALLSSQGNWLLLAWCRLRKDFRLFRLDRITELQVQNEKFEPHKITLDEYFKLH